MTDSARPKIAAERVRTRTITAQYGQTWDTVEGLEGASVIRLHPVTQAGDNPMIDNTRIPHGLKIMMHDSYGYQRELSILHQQHYSWKQEQVGTMTTQMDGEYQEGVPFEPIHNVPVMGEKRLVSDGLVWVVSAYKHPFRPAVESVVSESVAKRLIDRIMHLATEYPTLIFNPTVSGDRPRARAEGFVHFHDKLLAGAVPSVKLLP